MIAHFKARLKPAMLSDQADGVPTSEMVPNRLIWLDFPGIPSCALVAGKIISMRE